MLFLEEEKKQLLTRPTEQWLQRGGPGFVVVAKVVVRQERKTVYQSLRAILKGAQTGVDGRDGSGKGYRRNQKTTI